MVAVSFLSGSVFAASPPVERSGPPQTTIKSDAAGPSASTEARFTFASSQAESRFSCRLDSQPSSPCSSPRVYARLSQGLHRFAVQATDPAGNTDPTPAVRTWTVDTQRPPRPLLTATDPPSPSSEETARVIGSAQTGASVDVYGAAACSGSPLVSGTAAQLSSEGLEVHVRANSSTTLSAQATDLAGNGSTCSRSITYAQDSIPPETTIDSGPAPDTVNPDASFTLSSDDPSATFSCSLDSGAFRQCARRKTYPQLPAGRHTLRARARDAAGNVDRSPARLTFTLRADAPPNILLIITDDQPLDTMQVMPNALQFFAAEGTEFPHGYDVEPLCCPSRASIFSGKYPHNHGITINDGTGFDATDTWQRYLHELGYFTGITGKYLNAVATSKAPYFDYRFQVTPA